MASTNARWSIRSEQSILSIASKRSILSIGSVGSVLSIGSFASIGSMLADRSRWAVMQSRAWGSEDRSSQDP